MLCGEKRAKFQLSFLFFLKNCTWRQNCEPDLQKTSIFEYVRGVRLVYDWWANTQKYNCRNTIKEKTF